MNYDSRTNRIVEVKSIDDDVAHSQSERRFHALGVTASGRRLHVTFTLRAKGTLIRVISARDMHRKERAFHGKKT